MSTPSEPENWGDHPEFRTLRRLVTVLTLTLTIGVLTIAAALVIRILMEDGPPPVAAIGADEIEIPAAAKVLAVGATASAVTILIRDEAGGETLRVHAPDDGALVDEIAIRRAP